MIQEEELSKKLETLEKKLETLEQLITKVSIDNHKYRINRDEIRAVTNNIKGYIDDLLVGSITAFAMDKPPDGWLVCDGREVYRTEFARLFERVGQTFGDGDGSTTFNLPDLRGVSLRGWSAEGILDSLREFGSYQPDQMQSHKHDDSGHAHSGKTSTDGKHKHELKDGDIDYHDDGKKDALVYSEDLGERYGHDDDYIRNDGEHSHSLIISTQTANLGNPTNSYSGAGEPRHGNETRVKNVALLYCIKY